MSRVAAPNTGSFFRIAALRALIQIKESIQVEGAVNCAVNITARAT